MAVSPVFQSTPSFYVDFRQSKRLDSRIDFVRNSTATFINLNGLVVSASANQPRFDHNSVTGECNGLLIEEGRTNSITYSNGFDNAAWTKVNSSVTSNQSVSPDGTFSAYKLNANTTNGLHYIQHSTSLSTGYPYTFSVYAKSAEYNWISLNLTPNHSQAGTYFNLSSGTIGTVAPGYTAEITQMSNNWYRCSITYTGSTLSLRAQIELASADKGRTFASANTVSGIYIWGCQVERGEFATSYIPTTTATATRNADEVSISGDKLSPWYNQQEGTLIGNFKKVSTNVSFGYEISLTDTTSRLIVEQNSINSVVSSIVDDSGNLAVNSLTNPVSLNTTDYTSIIYDIVNDEISSSGATSRDASTKRVKNINYTVGLAYSPDNSFSCYNGNDGVAESTKEIISTMSKLKFGRTSSSAIGTGWMNWMRYYPTRLTNAQIKTLTR